MPTSGWRPSRLVLAFDLKEPQKPLRDSGSDLRAGFVLSKMLVGGGSCENMLLFFSGRCSRRCFCFVFCCRGKLVGGVILIYKVSWVSDEQMSNLNWLCYTKSVWVYECQRATGNGGWALGIVLIVYSMSVERNGKLQLVCDLTSFNCLEICFQEEAWNLRTKVFQDNMHASKVIYRLCISNPKVVIVRFWGILGYTCI